MLEIIISLVFAIIIVSFWIEVYLKEKKKRYLIMIIITILGEISWFIYKGYFLKILELI
ncbi:Uncharacterised protein [Streptococcus pneumoniae]|uniref:hypothetical protein n=1 Tax=Bacilli TaxID=91061 RepID=UPI000279613E|nr:MULTISPECIES: hypothetical protein [Bacilli]MDH6561120.1 hypothetical protein [Bacillus sp. LEw-kw-2]MDH8708594.1 hypothetical protein [Stenotrophomonas sp. 1198]MDP9749516.1 hypothetical protein [Bacillus thuringiensis]EJQ77009.1 hypothetical protein IGO_05743 [Bacillus toyonensis]EJS44918.1 hypothetical protein IC9_05570 [Bacillus toyonensis]